VLARGDPRNPLGLRPVGSGRAGLTAHGAPPLLAPSCDTRFARVWPGSIAPLVAGVLSLR